MPDASEEEQAAASFEDCCTGVELLGMLIYPNEAVFPAPHVCLRLELAAAGRWPENGPATEDDSRVASAMLKVPPLIQRHIDGQGAHVPTATPSSQVSSHNPSQTPSAGARRLDTKMLRLLS